MRKITPEQASAVFDILVRYAGCRDDANDRRSFIFRIANDDHPAREYRFGGDLGWGGKFRNNGNHDDTPYVNCYSEHLNPQRRGIIAVCNAELAMLFGERVP